MITATELRELMNYDPETGIFTAIFGVRGAAAGRIAGHEGKRGYRRIYLKGRNYWAHRLAWLYVNGEHPQDEIDHINGDKSDNRISNLRQASRLVNARNKPLCSRNKSGANGVYRSKAGRWSACIKVMKKKISLGTFDTFEDAVAARKSADEKYGFHSNHGRRNTPTSTPPLPRQGQQGELEWTRERN